VFFAPHTNGPRDVPRCGALSLLQKPLHYRGIQQVSLLALTKFVRSGVAALPSGTGTAEYNLEESSQKRLRVGG
jgi:hypothetical protein